MTTVNAKKPKKPSAAALKSEQIANLLAALEAAGVASRIPTIASLTAELEAADVGKLLKDKTAKEQVVFIDDKSPASPVVLRRDLGRLAQSDELLTFAAARVRAKRAGKKPPKSLLAKKFVDDAGLKPAELKEEFQVALERRIMTSGLPSDLRDLIVVPIPPRALAEKLIALIRSQRNIGGVAYPLAADAWTKLAPDIPPADIKKALKEPAFTQAGTILKPTRYLLTADLDSPPAAWINQAFGATVGSTSAGKNTLTSAEEISAVMLGGAAAKTKGKAKPSPLAAAVERAADRGELGPDVAWLWRQGERLFFRRVDVEPKSAQRSTPSGPAAQASPVTADFASRFHAAFDRANARCGGRNFVKLAEVRRELADVSRPTFDAGLRELRLADRYALNSSEGGEQPLTAAEREAGIQEAGSLLVYISRK